MKIENLPPFVLGKHYRELSTAEGNRKYRFRTEYTTRLKLKHLVHETEILCFYCGAGREWMRIDQYGIRIAEGYAWNGCTPKYGARILGWVGTPDFEDTILASLIHDALYQFHGTKHFPFSRAQCDEIFRQIVELSGSPKIASLYHWAVRKFGRWSFKTPDGEVSARL